MGRLKRSGAIAVAVVALVGGLCTQIGAAPVGYSTTPIQGWSTNGTVWKVLVVGDTVYAGGAFSQVRSPAGATLARTNLAAFDLHTGAIRTGFVANANAAVRSLAYDNGRLYVGGNFTTISGQNRQRLAAVDGNTGAAVTGFTANASSTVHALALNGSRLYAGGAFTTINGVARNRIAAVSTATGALDASFNPDANNEIRALVTSPDGAIVYAGGLYTAIGGANRSYLVPLSSTTGAALPLVFERGDRGRVFDLDISPSGNQLFAALGDLENRAEAWNTATGARQWQQIAMGDVQSISYYQGNVYFSFHEGFANDTSVRILAADAITGALAPNFRPPVNTFYAIWATDAAADGLVVGGEFTTISGVQTRGVAILPFNPPDPQAPTPPTNVTVSGTTATTVSLTWTAGTDNVGVAGYRVVRNGIEVGYPTATSFTDTNLAPNASYTYTVQTLDTGGRLSTPSAPVETGTNVTLLPARSTWRYLDNGSNQGTAWRAPGFDASSWAQGPAQLGYGDGDEATTVGFGPNANQKYITTYFRTQFNVASLSTIGTVTLQLQRDDGAVIYLNGTEVARNNLAAGTVTSTTIASATVDGAAEQAFVPIAINSSLLQAGTNTIAVEVHQRAANSSDISFDLAVESTRRAAAPAPTNLQSTGVTGTTANLAWTAPAGTVTGYRVYRNGGLVGTPGTTTFQDTGLTSATTYTYTVSALDGAGVESPTSAPLAVTTADTVAPGTPTGLAAPTVGAGHVVLTWTAPTDNVAVTGYDVLRDGVVVGSPASATFDDVTVVPNHSYTYAVRARDAAGNLSPLSADLGVTTPESTGDVSAPSIPQNLRVTGRSTTTVSLAWDASTDDTGVTSYAVLRNGVAVGSSPTTTFTDNILAPGVTYSYTVTARDAATNVSAPSGAVPATTHSAVETLFPRNSVWRYTDDGIDRGTAWRQVAYDDSTWKSGAGQLGRDDGDEATILAGNQISYYLRRNVTVSDPGQISALTLSLLRDDGVVVYVNGVEAFRNNMPTGTITSATYANVALSGAAENAYVDFTIPPSMLVAGTNVIAVSLHNNSRTGDAGFDAELRAGYL